MTLQKRIKSMVDKNTSLASVIQVMLFRRILPCQGRTQRMWEFAAGPWTLQLFFGTKHEDMWKLLFKTQKTWPKMTEDLGLDRTHAASPVSFHNNFTICKSKGHTKLSILPTGLDEKGGADPRSSSAARRPNYSSTNEDAGSGAILGAGEEG